MVGVVERALYNIFEPMTQDERMSCINYLRTHFESGALGGGDTPKLVADEPVSKRSFGGGRRSAMPFYVKTITGVDKTKHGGFAILGDFVQPSKIGGLGDGTRILVGTKTSPKKYALATVKGGAGLCFEDGAGRELTVLGAELVLLSTCVKDIIEALER